MKINRELLRMWKEKIRGENMNKINQMHKM